MFSLLPPPKGTSHIQNPCRYTISHHCIHRTHMRFCIADRQHFLREYLQHQVSVLIKSFQPKNLPTAQLIFTSLTSSVKPPIRYTTSSLLHPSVNYPNPNQNAFRFYPYSPFLAYAHLHLYYCLLPILTLRE